MYLKYVGNEPIMVATVKGKKEIKKGEIFETKKERDLIRNYKNLFENVDAKVEEKEVKKESKKSE